MYGRPRVFKCMASFGLLWSVCGRLLPHFLPQRFLAMPLLRKEDFASLCGLQIKHVSTYIKRSKIVQMPNGLFDTDDAINKAFIDSRKGKETESDLINRLKKHYNVPDAEEDDAEDTVTESGTPPLHRSTALLKHLDTIKRKEEITKLRIDIEKKRGEVVPSSLITPVLLQHNKSLSSSFKDAADELIREFAKRKDLSGSEVADIRGRLIDIINSAMKAATSMSVKSIEHIINDFSDKRGKGEKVS